MKAVKFDISQLESYEGQFLGCIYGFAVKMKYKTEICNKLESAFGPGAECDQDIEFVAGKKVVNKEQTPGEWFYQDAPGGQHIMFLLKTDEQMSYAQLAFGAMEDEVERV